MRDGICALLKAVKEIAAVCTLCGGTGTLALKPDGLPGPCTACGGSGQI